MITWLTVWVLTVWTKGHRYDSASYQLTYATREICEKQKVKHDGIFKEARCDFQQVPMVVNK